MPKLTRTEIEERQRFVVETWKKLLKGLQEGENVPAAKVNAMIFDRYQENMRSDKVYKLRDVAIQELREKGVPVPEPQRKHRKPPEAGSAPAPPTTPVPSFRGQPPKRVDVVAGLPQIISGLATMEPAAAAQHVLRRLHESGHINVTVEHATRDYVVVNVAP
jgi:hypothetical protein